MIHIMRYLCPLRHCYAVVAWDGHHGSVAGARFDLGEFVVEAAEKHGTDVPVCPICGSTAFTAEDSMTPCTSMQEAAAVLMWESLLQLEMWLVMDPSRN